MQMAVSPTYIGVSLIYNLLIAIDKNNCYLLSMIIGLHSMDYKWWNTCTHIQASLDHHWTFRILVALLRWSTCFSGIMLLLC